MDSSWLTRTGVIVIYLMVMCTTITSAQLKKSHHHQEEVESNLNEADNTAKDNSRLQTVEGKVKSPSPKVILGIICIWSHFEISCVWGRGMNEMN